MKRYKFSEVRRPFGSANIPTNSGLPILYPKDKISKYSDNMREIVRKKYYVLINKEKYIKIREDREQVQLSPKQIEEINEIEGSQVYEFVIGVYTHNNELNADLMVINTESYAHKSNYYVSELQNLDKLVRIV